jgi:hypothetical protein
MISCSDSESLILNKNVTRLIAHATVKSPFLFQANSFQYLFSPVSMFNCRYVSTAAKLINNRHHTEQHHKFRVHYGGLPFNVSQFEVFSHLTFSVEHGFSNYGTCTTMGTPTTVYRYVALIKNPNVNKSIFANIQYCWQYYTECST